MAAGWLDGGSGALGLGGLALAEDAADGDEEIFVVDGLLEEGRGAAGEGAVFVFGGIAGGDDDDGDVGDFTEALHPLHDVEAVPLEAGAADFGGEIDVEDNEVGALLAGGADGAGTVGGGEHLE